MCVYVSGSQNKESLEIDEHETPNPNGKYSNTLIIVNIVIL